MAEKRYYWLKLKENYFDSPKIKKLRRIAGGDTYTIIYLKMQLLSVSNGGVITFEGIEDNFEEELALKLDEQVEDVQLTLAYLKQQSLVEAKDEEFLFVEACNNIGTETSSAERVRRFREKKENLKIEKNENIKALQSNASVTKEKRNYISISISNSISNIFNHWNSKNIIKHKELTNERAQAIEKALKKYSEEDIKKFIDRYDMVIKDKHYFFDYKWTLEDFLNRRFGMATFKDEGSKWVSYNNQKIVYKKGDEPEFEQRQYTKEDFANLIDDLDDIEL